AFLDAPSAAGPLRDAIAARLASPDAAEPARQADVARAIDALVRATPLPDEVAVTVLQAYRTLPTRNGSAPRVAVRSSAPGAGGAGRVAGGEGTPVRLGIDRASGRILAAHGVPGAAPAPLAQALARLGGRVEKLFGGPQDIEWARGEDGRVYLLQARPVT